MTPPVEKRDDGGPAFPNWTYNNPEGLDDASKRDVGPGMSMRQYYAGEALIGILQLHGYVTGGAPRAAQMAVEMADALIAELKK